MLEELKVKVCNANLDLVKHGIEIFSFGNVSAIDRKYGLVVIKPSGVDYSVMTPEDMVIVDLNGRKIEGRLNPSSDMPTHLEIYKAFTDVGGIAHTHSSYATAWAQAGRDIPYYGITHADYFNGSIPCTRTLSAYEVSNDYEKNTGILIVRTIADRNPLDMPGALVRNHGAFSWGIDAETAVNNAAIMEYCAKMAIYTERINAEVEKMPKYILDRHCVNLRQRNSNNGRKI